MLLDLITNHIYVVNGLKKQVNYLKRKGNVRYELEEVQMGDEYENNGICLNPQTRLTLKYCMQKNIPPINTNDEIFCYNVITSHFKEDMSQLIRNIKADVCKTGSVEKTNQLAVELFGKPIFIYK